MKDFQFLQQKYILNTYPNRQLTFTKGEGIYLFDQNHEKYLDLMSNYGVTIFGYNHPAITRSLTEQIKLIPTLHGSFNNDTRAQASEALVKRCGSDYMQVYWSSSGAEAIEAALKFAVLTTQKKKFIVADHGYHGKTLGALSATSGEKYKQPFAPLLWEFISIPFNDLQALEQAIDDTTAAFIVEPIQGEGGIFLTADDYLEKVREICTKKGILLIIDEIQTGVGRTGTFLCSEGIAADILCLGKGLAAGIPVGATLVNQKIISHVPKNIHTSTFGGNPLACAGVLVTLSLLDKSQLTHIKNLGNYFLTQMKKLKESSEAKKVRDVRGVGLMLGLEVLPTQRNQLLKLLQQEKILVIPAGESVVRFLPPYIIQEEVVDLVIEKLKKILNKI